MICVEWVINVHPSRSLGLLLLVRWRGLSVYWMYIMQRTKRDSEELVEVARCLKVRRGFVCMD